MKNIIAILLLCSATSAFAQTTYQHAIPAGSGILSAPGTKGGTPGLVGLNVANGVLGLDSSGRIPSSAILANGVTASTQSSLDNSAKVATTGYADNAVGVETSRAETAEAGKQPSISGHSGTVLLTAPASTGAAPGTLSLNTGNGVPTLDSNGNVNALNLNIGTTTQSLQTWLTGSVAPGGLFPPFGNYQGSGNPAIQVPNNSSLIIYNANGTISNKQLLLITKTTNGVTQQSNAFALHVNDDVTTTESGQEWAGYFSITGESGSSTRMVPLTTLAQRNVGATNAMWGDLVQSNDLSGLPSSGMGQQIGIEIDESAYGLDNGGNSQTYGNSGIRKGVQFAFFGANVGGQVPTEFSSGLWFNTDGYAYIDQAIGFSANASIANVLDTRGVVAPANDFAPVAAVKASCGQVVDLDGNATTFLVSPAQRALEYNCTDAAWEYISAGHPSGPLFKVDDSGDLTIAGSLTASSVIGVQPSIAAASGQLLAGPTSTGAAPVPTTVGAGLTLSGNALSVSNPANAVDVQAFTASGTWTKPSFCSSGNCMSQVTVIGGGGGGGGGAMQTFGGGIASGGGSGGDGACLSETVSTSLFSSSVAVTIGNPGTGGAGASAVGAGTSGTQGSGSTFGTYLKAGGGGLGSGGQLAAGSGGGATGGYGGINGNPASGANGGSANVGFGMQSGGSAAQAVPNVYGLDNAPGSGSSTSAAFVGPAAKCLSGAGSGGVETVSSVTNGGAGGSVIGGLGSLPVGGASSTSGNGTAGGVSQLSVASTSATYAPGGGGASSVGIGGAGGACGTGYGVGGAGGGAGDTGGGAGGNACPGFVEIKTWGI